MVDFIRERTNGKVTDENIDAFLTHNVLKLKSEASEETESETVSRLQALEEKVDSIEKKLDRILKKLK